MDQGLGPSGDHQGSQPSGLLKPRGIKKYLKKYTIRDVVRAQYGLKVSNLASQESQDKPGTSAYLAAMGTLVRPILPTCTHPHPLLIRHSWVGEHWYSTSGHAPHCFTFVVTFTNVSSTHECTSVRAHHCLVVHHHLVACALPCSVPLPCCIP